MALSEAQWPRVFEAHGQGPTQEEIDQAKRQRMEEARQQARRKKDSPSEAEELFDVLDVNHDGMLSREEFAQAIRSKMKQQVGLQATETDTLVRSVMGSTIEVPAAEPLTQLPPGPPMMPVMPVPLQQLTGGPGPQMQPMGPPAMQRGAPNGQMLMPPHGMMIPVGPPQGSPRRSGPMLMGPPVQMMPGGGPVGQGSPPPSGPMQMGPPPVQMVPAGGPPGSPPPSGPMQMGPPPVKMMPAGGPPGSPPPSGPMQMGPPPVQMVPAGGPPGSPPPSGPMQMGPPPVQMLPVGGPPGSPPPSGPMQMGPRPVQMLPVGGPPGSPPPSGPMHMGPPPVQMLPVGGPPGSPPPSGPMQMGPPPVQMMPGGPGPMMPMPMEPNRPFGPGPGPMQLAPPGPCRPFGPPGAPGMPQGPLDVTRRYSGVAQQQMVPLPRTNPLEALWSQSQMQAQRLNYMEGEMMDVKKMIQMMVERQNKASFSEDSEKASRRQRAVMAAQRSARLKDESSPDSDGSFIANMRNHAGFEAKSHDLASPTSEEERRAKLRDAKMGSMSRMPNPNQSIEFALPVDRPDPFMPSDGYGYDYGDSYGVEELKGMHQSLHGQTRDPDSMMSIEFHKRPELGGSLRQDAVFTPGGGSYDDPALGFGMPGQNPSELRTGSMNLIKKDWNMDDKYIPNEMYEKDGAHHESISGNPIPSLPTVRQDRRDEACQLM